MGALLLIAHVTATIVFSKPDGRVIFGDATHHFVQLRSMVFDRDLDFKNEHMRLHGLSENAPDDTAWINPELTPNGHVRNFMPVGPALLWAPLYLIAAGIQLMLSYAGAAPRPDGFDRVLQMVPGVTGVLSATWGAWLSWRLARRFTDARSAAVGVWGVWLGSHAIYYSLVAPSYSHAASMLTSALFFSHWLGSPVWSTRRAAVSGALAGLAALMRWQDALFLAVPVVEAWRWSAPTRDRLAASLAAVVAWVAVFSPQMIVWRVLYDHWLAVPQGPSFLHWTSPHPIAVLLSDNHGLFSWAPVLVAAVAGLIGFAARHRRFALPLAGVVLASWYVNAAVADWWAGEAYGARRFLSLFPLFVVGLATWIQAGRLPAKRIAVVVVLVAANWLFLLQYEIFMKGYRTLAPYPNGWFNLFVARFVVPVRLMARWLS